jgi:hypothetical protein
MAASSVLIHSPSVGPRTWQPDSISPKRTPTDNTWQLDLRRSLSPH